MPWESKSSPRAIENYLGRISGPLLDRIDMHIEVPAVKFHDMTSAMTEMNFSARAYDRILKVSRTIADLAGSKDITADHVSEAIQFRSLDRQICGKRHVKRFSHPNPTNRTRHPVSAGPQSNA